MIIMLKTSNYSITLLFNLQNVNNIFKQINLIKYFYFSGFFKLNKVIIII